MKYIISGENPHQQFFQIRFEAETKEDKTLLCFPDWRPGRYQSAGFAKNIKSFKVFDDTGKPIPYKKIALNKWEVDSSKTKNLVVTYQYYAHEINAGSSYLDDSFWYINPINCCIHILEQTELPCSLHLKDVPEEYMIASSASFDKKKTAYFSSYHELVDTPLIASESLQFKKYQISDVDFTIWFHGEIRPEWDKMLKDFQAFTKKQIDVFKEFPANEFHFLTIILPFRAYHGVEHLKSTVVTLGPTYEIFSKLYTELLGVCSHELYHCWNVKSIRPAEWLPYDYATVSPSEMGYLAEGVTTYMGDILLYRSKVFNFETYAKELALRIESHLHNFGRFNYSVAESSYDTWLDGYEPGVPNRKVSIYNEGCILAFYTDIWMMQQSANKRGLQDVMRKLYFEYALKGKGITKEFFLNTIQSLSGESYTKISDAYFYKNSSYESLISEAFDYLGLELILKPNTDKVKSLLGGISIKKGKGVEIKRVAPGSSLELSGVREGDEIIGINGKVLNSDIQEWLSYHESDEIILTIDRMGKELKLLCPNIEKKYFPEVEIKRLASPNKNQEIAFKFWST